ncbi:MAG: hypothetical protein JF603_05380 [Acidobacteria bacterium]|nr:hypothetical protein [Acidobacteriota bacterium]
MADDAVLDAFCSELTGLRGAALGLEEMERWIADVAVFYGVQGGNFFAQIAPGTRFRRAQPWVNEVRALYYAYLLPEVAARFGTTVFEVPEIRDRIRGALGSYSANATEMLDADRSDRTAAVFKLSRLISETCRAAGLRKIGDGIQASSAVLGALAAANGFMSDIIANGTIAPPNSPEPAGPSGSRLPPIVTLTGDALGYEGEEREAVDLCLAFGAALSSFLTDEGAELTTEDHRATVAVAGFLAAAPLVAARLGVDVLHDPKSSEQAQSVCAAFGFPTAELLELLAAGDSTRFLGRLASSTRERLAVLGTTLPDQVFIELPSWMAAAAAMIDSR